jgi:uncharacterized protein DUF2057
MKLSAQLISLSLTPLLVVFLIQNPAFASKISQSKDTTRSTTPYLVLARSFEQIASRSKSANSKSLRSISLAKISITSVNGRSQKDTTNRLIARTSRAKINLLNGVNKIAIRCRLNINSKNPNPPAYVKTYILSFYAQHKHQYQLDFRSPMNEKDIDDFIFNFQFWISDTSKETNLRVPPKLQIQIASNNALEYLNRLTRPTLINNETLNIVAPKATQQHNSQPKNERQDIK